MAIGRAVGFPEPVTNFHDRRLPQPAAPAGYAALIHAYGLRVPWPRTLAAIGERHRLVEVDGWRILTPRHAPHPTLEGHLTFALKYEGLDLAVLKRLFLAAGPKPIEEIVLAKPTGTYARRLWFLYEWLTGATLDLPDVRQGRYVTALDPEHQWGIAGTNSPRQRVRNNLPGTPGFCPLIFRTEALVRGVELDLRARAATVAAGVSREILARTAAFLLLKDSRSSFAIEGERPPQDRIQRWGRAIAGAGRAPIDRDELLRLQRVVIGDARFVRLGLRAEAGFVGDHERETGAPRPDHISANPEDLDGLIAGLAAFDRGR